MPVAPRAQSATGPDMLASDLRSLVDALDEPALVVERGIVSFANGAAQKILGYGIEGKDIRLAIRHPQALDHILGQRSADVDVTGLVEPGRSWRLIVRRLDGAVLVRMVDRSDAVSAERMRVDFVANASHELRTPLATVLGYAETLAEGAELSPELVARFGTTIRDEARRMLGIIEDLMSLSRIEADRFIAPSERVEVSDVVETAVANLGHLRSSANCQFDVRLQDGLPSLRGDRAQLVQLLDNLIANAVRYGCDRSGARIEIGAERDGTSVLIHVADHGPGIAREHLPRLTERFYRADEARSRESGGTGLGLAIVKHIVERHRGSLEIKSAVGAGTTVTVRLPAGA